MARKAHRSVKFELSEDGNLLRGVLSVNGVVLFDSGNREAAPIVVRHPKASAAELLDHAQYWSRRDQATGTPSEWFKKYIRSREEDAAKQLQEIRKSLRRIEGSMFNAELAKDIRRDLEK